MRIQKYLSEQKIASRREAERYITAGLVKVNGVVVTNMATQIDPAHDTVELLGGATKAMGEKVTIAINKPRGYVSSKLRHEGTPVFDLVPQYDTLNAVGRLDKESEGLLLLSNDGAITAAITGDEHLIEKEYEVSVRERITESKINKMASGIELEDGLTLPAKAKQLADHEFRIILKEGRKHQIRRMCEAMHLTVTSLKRLRIGTIKLGTLVPGKFRKLSPQEVASLKNATKKPTER